MSRRWVLRAEVVAALGVSLAMGGCVSVPRDAGMSDVQKQVQELGGQKIAWSPERPIEPPDDGKLRPLLAGEISVERAVEIALAHNQSLFAALEELGVARADLIAMSTVRNPVFDGEIRFPGDPRKPFEIGITQTLIDLFQLRKRRALGEAAFEAARLRVTGTILGFAAGVRTDYYTLQAARAALDQQRTITEAAAAAAELARRQHDAGNVSDLDLESEQALYELAKIDLSRTELDELLSRERLLADLGALETLPLTLTAQEPPAEDGRERSLEEVEAAFPGRIDVLIGQADLKAARQALPLSRSSSWDELALGVHREREPEGEQTTGPALAIPLPIFDRGLAGRVRAEAHLRMAEQRLHALAVNARSEARAARERLLEARARAEYLRTVVVPRRQRILYLTQLEHNSMLRGVYDLLRARQDLAAALREQVMAVRDYWLAHAGLEAVMNGVSGLTAANAGSMSPLGRSQTSLRQESQGHE